MSLIFSDPFLDDGNQNLTAPYPSTMATISISKRRFDALAGYTRQPSVVVLCEELAWHSSTDGRVIGVILRDRTDGDFSWVVLGRDRLKRFRALDLNVSLATEASAQAELLGKLEQHAQLPNESFYQQDEEGEPVNFFEPVVPAERLHPNFKLLTSDERYSPARELISAMMRYHTDVDGNFVEQFQTTGFDARLWELYLFAVLVELGYARELDAVAPDFCAQGLSGKVGIEAVTANPPQSGIVPPLTNASELTDYLQNYIPFKLAKGLTRKLRRSPPYWQEPCMADVPFLIGIQDFHATGSMRMIVPAATEYVFGYRHIMESGGLRIERIVEHRVGNLAEPSGFFTLPNSEHISAVLLNPQGTLLKFNRMGLLAGFGSRRVRMTRTGVLRREGQPDGPTPRPFTEEVTSSSQESWIEGMVVLHNPQARIPLEPDQFLGANHEFVQPDGRIFSLVPDFHPYFSQTQISLDGEEPTSAGE